MSPRGITLATDPQHFTGAVFSNQGVSKILFNSRLPNCRNLEYIHPQIWTQVQYYCTSLYTDCTSFCSLSFVLPSCCGHGSFFTVQPWTQLLL
ncbi:hypothetical protein FVE85_5175 [Porphyridium purpureum]|uniref:Uncharacterized protein n=1 Tax=Porphyridium purpureum TaxID=35688 RepID=A0A5J4YPF8_PORPP|nr:hypothetical protein FVE85_9569 [Porphyridium purpureum]KAA8491005.1 hypothetical protein FVE85_9897 [Porphyridium purpureum]KAA8492297.1 hypothetical protein FVE85_3735 [Porphyridium purpureum]KAA8497590.1 hypothetical protein FVE85_5175 [Porphyridium purpureum]|eukprot:POR5926..scf295_1